MSLAERLELAWETLEAGRTGEALVRTLGDIGVPTDALLGVDDTGGREVLFRIAADVDVATPPPVRGVRVLIRTVRSAATSERFLVVRCDRLSSHRVFARFAADVIEQVADNSHAAAKVVEVLGAWRELFRREAVDPESLARGLFGELDELRRLAAMDPAAIETWRGPTSEPQDFVRGRFALEVKSTRTRARFVEVHGLLQLWARPFESLLLAVKHVGTDAAGETVGEVVTALIANGVDGGRLWELMEQAGFAERDVEAASALRFRVRDTRYFRVTDSTPALTPDSLAMPSLPTGISQLTYALALDADGLIPCSASELEESTSGLLGSRT